MFQNTRAIRALVVEAPMREAKCGGFPQQASRVRSDRSSAPVDFRRAVEVHTERRESLPVAHEPAPESVPAPRLRRSAAPERSSSVGSGGVRHLRTATAFLTAEGAEGRRGLPRNWCEGGVPGGVRVSHVSCSLLSPSLSSAFLCALCGENCGALNCSESNTRSDPRPLDRQVESPSWPGAFSSDSREMQQRPYAIAHGRCCCCWRTKTETARHRPNPTIVRT